MFGIADLVSADWAARLLDPSRRLSLLPLMTAVLFAAFVYWRDEDRTVHKSFWRYLVPREIWRHRSTALDLQLAALSLLVKPAKILLFGLTVAIASAAAAKGLGQIFGPPPFLMSGSWPVTALLVVLLFLATDFSTYLVHRLSHQVPLLWAFHRVHHSAEVLNPATLLRKHPVYDVVSKLVDLAILTPIYALILYFWPPAVGASAAFGVRAGFGLFALLAGNLRHSHIWLSFGPFERLLVSPAQHQIHHSVAERHWDRNFGEVLAIWDWLLGTLYLPREREQLRFGLAGEEQPHPNLWRLLFEPFVFALCLRGRAAQRADLTATE